MPIRRLPTAALHDAALSAPLRRALGVLLRCGRAGPGADLSDTARCRAVRLSMFWRDPYFYSHNETSTAKVRTAALPESDEFVC